MCREVRSVDPTIRGLILTSFDDDDALVAAILAGASGYLLKDIKGNDLVDAIRRVAAGENLLDPARSPAAARTLRNAPADVDPRLQQLTPQERRILDHVADGLTNRQIGETMSLAEKTVKNYVTSVLAQARHGAPDAGRGLRRDPRHDGWPRHERHPLRPRMS